MPKLLREFFSESDRPVVPRERDPITPTTRWKNLVGVGLTKTFTFEDRRTRDHFVIQCLALETHREKRDVTWTIDGKDVTILLKTDNIGLTEIIVEFAATLDSMRKDLIIPEHDKEELIRPNFRL